MKPMQGLYLGIAMGITLGMLSLWLHFNQEYQVTSGSETSGETRFITQQVSNPIPGNATCQLTAIPSSANVGDTVQFVTDGNQPITQGEYMVVYLGPGQSASTSQFNGGYPNWQHTFQQAGSRQVRVTIMPTDPGTQPVRCKTSIDIGTTPTFPNPPSPPPGGPINPPTPPQPPTPPTPQPVNHCDLIAQPSTAQVGQQVTFVTDGNQPITQGAYTVIYSSSAGNWGGGTSNFNGGYPSWQHAFQQAGVRNVKVIITPYQSNLQPVSCETDLLVTWWPTNPTPPNPPAPTCSIDLTPSTPTVGQPAQIETNGTVSFNQAVMVTTYIGPNSSQTTAQVVNSYPTRNHTFGQQGPREIHTTFVPLGQNQSPFTCNHDFLVQ